MWSINEIRRMNKKSSFQRTCERIALKRHNKRLADLTDEQIAQIAKYARGGGK